MSVMRGQGAGARAVLLRVDGAGTIEVIPFDQLRYSKVKLPNAPGKITPLPLAGGRELAVPNYPDNQAAERPLNLFGVQTVTDMAYYEGRWAGLPAHVEQRPRRHEGSHGGIWHDSADHHTGQRR